MPETSTDEISKDLIKQSPNSSKEVILDKRHMEELQVSSKSIGILPSNIWTNILEQYTLDLSTTVPQILFLREVDRWFNDEVLSILYTRQLVDFSHIWRHQRVPLDTTICFLQGFFAKRKLPVKAHKQMRRAMLRAVGIDPRVWDAAEGTCLTLKPTRPCSQQAEGPSSGPRCKMHDMMAAIALAFGSNVFLLGRTLASSLTTFPATDSRCWTMLTLVYQVGKNPEDEKAITELKLLLQELNADVTLPEDAFSNLICDCFLLAVRLDSPALIDFLYTETDDEKDLAGKLGRRATKVNALWESIELGHVEVHKKFLSKKWEFDPDINTYGSCMSNLVYQRKLPAATRATMLRSMFDWSNEWRKTYILDTLLISIGNAREPELMDAVVSAIRAQHFFVHSNEEENNPYHGPPAQPLWSLAHHDNPVQMVKAFLDNRHLVLPHMKHDRWKDMRIQTIQLLFRDRSGKDQSCQASTEVLKLIIEHSQDLLDAKHSLQQTVILNCDDLKLEKWDWLAEKIGLDTKCDQTHEGHTLGSALMEVAVEKLNVEIVRFLVKNGVGLVKEATTIRIKEEDEEAMKKLEAITELLAEGGQGEYTQKRTVCTTFSASKVVPPKPKKKSVVESSPIVRISSTAVRMSHAPRPRSLKRMSISKRHGTKLGMKSGSIIAAESVSSGSSVSG